MKKALSLWLCLLLILPCILLAGCGGKPQTPVDTTPPPSDAGTGELDEWGRPMIYSPLDLSVRYDDSKLRVLSRDDGGSVGQFVSADTETDVVNNATVKRNELLYSRLGITVESLPTKGGSWNAELNSKIRTHVNFDSDEFDLIANFAYYGSALAQEGYYYDWSKVNNIYTDQPYWNQSFIEQSVLGDRMYMVVNDSCLRVLKHTFATFFNKRLASNWLDGVDLYQVVNDGEWTLAYFSEAVKNVHSELDNVGGATEGDVYGLITSVSSQNIDAYFYGMGLHCCKFSNESQLPELCLNDDLALAAFEAVRDLMFANDGVYVTGTDTNNHYVGARKAFSECRSLFSIAPVDDGGFFKSADMADDFGILPLPKADEGDPYTSSSQDAYDFLCLPSNISKDKTSMVGASVEYMAYLSYLYIQPAYYETVLKSRYSQEAKDARMFDIITANNYFDFGVIYSSSITGAGVHLGHFWPNIFQTMYNNKNTNLGFGNEYEKYQESYGTQLQSVIDMLLE